MSKLTELGRLMRQVWKVLLDGLKDSDSPLFKLLGVQKDVVEEIIWKKMLVVDWQMKISKPYHLLKEIENEKRRMMEYMWMRRRVSQSFSKSDILWILLLLVLCVLVRKLDVLIRPL